MASPTQMNEVTQLLRGAADRLESEMPEPGAPSRKFSDVPSVGSMVDAMPFDVVVGDCNPLAPPMELFLEGGEALGRVTFDVSYEGAPGCVHGAVIAGAFDLILTAANVLAGSAGPTIDLGVKFLKPTLIGHECTLEAFVVASEGRRIRSRGTLTQRGTITAEAEGEFVSLDRSAIDALHKKAAGG